jgi:O-antigen/teichoic acid export membrane protein
MKEDKEALGVTSARLLSSLYLGQGIGIVITVITFIFVTRLLGAGGYGIYTFAFGFSALIDCVGNFGMGNYFGRQLARFTYKKDHKGIMETLITGYSILLPITIALTLLGIALSPYVANVLFRSLDISPLTLMLAASIIFFSTTESTAIQALIGLTRGKLASLVSVVVDIIQLVASVYLVLTGHGVNGAIIGMLVGYIIGAVFAFYLIFRIVSKQGPVKLHLPSKVEFKSAFSFVFPMSLNNIMNFSMVNFAILYLSYFVSISMLGNYGAALRGLTFIAIFYSTMSTGLLPLFATAGEAKKASKVDKTYNKLLLYSLLITLPFIVYVAVLAKPGVHLLLSSQFNSAGLYLSLIALGTMIDAFQYYLASLLISKGFTTSLLKTLIVSTILQLLTVLILVPKFGVLGAIAGIFFVGSSVETILFLRLAKKLMDFRLDYRKIGLLFASNILLVIPLSVALLFSSSIVSLIVGLLILLVVYPALIVLLNVVTVSDVDLISGISKKIPALNRLVSLMTGYLGFLLRIKSRLNR